MKISLRGLFVLVISALFFSVSASAQTRADKKVKSSAIFKDLKIKPHESLDKQEMMNQYTKNRVLWDKVIAWLKEHDLEAVANGKYTIVPDSATVSVTEGPTKNQDATKWESHRKFIDIQYIVKGKEKIGVAPVSSATVINPYNEAKDVANYTADGTYYVSDPSTFFIFFPSDAHRPTIKVDGYDVVKKIVVKVRYVE